LLPAHFRLDGEIRFLPIQFGLWGVSSIANMTVYDVGAGKAPTDESYKRNRGSTLG